MEPANRGHLSPKTTLTSTKGITAAGFAQIFVCFTTSQPVALCCHVDVLQHVLVAAFADGGPLSNQDRAAGCAWHHDGGPLSNPDRAAECAWHHDGGPLSNPDRAAECAWHHDTSKAAQTHYNMFQSHKQTTVRNFLRDYPSFLTQTKITIHNMSQWELHADRGFLHPPTHGLVRSAWKSEIRMPQQLFSHTCSKGLADHVNHVCICIVLQQGARPLRHRGSPMQHQSVLVFDTTASVPLQRCLQRGLKYACETRRPC